MDTSRSVLTETEENMGYGSFFSVLAPGGERMNSRSAAVYATEPTASNKDTCCSG